MIEVRELEIPGVLLLEPRRHADDRGAFCETFSARELEAAGACATFVQDNHSVSRPAGVLRGLHFQKPPMDQAKLVRIVRGRVLDVAVDLRQGSPFYGRHVAVELSADNWRQLYVPPGFAHGFLTLEPDTEALYKVSAYYAPEAEGGLPWDDPDLAIPWPEVPGGVTLSDKDRRYPPFAVFESPWTMRDAA